MKRSAVIFITATLISTSLFAQKRNGVAVIVDNQSWQKCESAIESYAASTAADGYSAFIAHGDWETPEAVRDSIRKWYEEKNLAGAVFIGDIPVPMIRQAQFLTSAFKMDEKSTMFPWRDTSVPSDRFYDDFDLKFDFIKRDSAETSFFYYNLAPEGRQRIDCDIFTGRIKPSGDYGDRYEELNAYLNKVVRVKAEDRQNKLDKVASYSGSGSFSNCMIAWKDEGITLQEQIPDAFKTIEGARFFEFYKYPYIKDVLLQVAHEKDLDMFLFHNHGTPDRQWIQNLPPAESLEEANDNAKLNARLMIRQRVRYGSTPEEAMAAVLNKYPELDSCWVTNAFDPEVMKADSIADIRTGIVLSDVIAAEPSVRLSIFDACYNGDFRESDCIANRYIFSKGNSIAGLGNSVNVLQDKHSSHLLGMLTAGYSIGEWHQMTAILESHVIGDPTYRFHSDFNRPELSSDNVKLWKKYLSPKYPIDIQGLALERLSALNAEGMSRTLLDTYKNSDSYMLRLQCLKLLQYYDTPEYHEALRLALDDPYEYIRRKAVTFLSMRGEDSDVELLVNDYFRDNNAKRVAFNLENGSCFFRDSLFLEKYNESLAGQDFIYYRKDGDGKALANDVYDIGRFRKSYSKKDYFTIGLFQKNSKRRVSNIQMMRNFPIPEYAGNLIALVKDETLPDDVRICSAEVLGWYIRAYNKSGIVAELEKIQDACTPEVNREIKKTIARLQEYQKK